MAKDQTELKGIERPVIKAIEDAAEDYETIRDKRMALTEKEIEAKSKLLDLMKKHKCKLYRYDERIVELVPGEDGVKVKKAKDPTVEKD